MILKNSNDFLDMNSLGRNVASEKTFLGLFEKPAPNDLSPA
jgi:hypothetical protein